MSGLQIVSLLKFGRTSAGRYDLDGISREVCGPELT